MYIPRNHDYDASVPASVTQQNIDLGEKPTERETSPAGLVKVELPLETNKPTNKQTTSMYPHSGSLQ